jgi:hypothetical protein
MCNYGKEGGFCDKIIIQKLPDIDILVTSKID